MSISYINMRVININESISYINKSISNPKMRIYNVKTKNVIIFNQTPIKSIVRSDYLKLRSIHNLNLQSWKILHSIFP